MKQSERDALLAANGQAPLIYDQHPSITLKQLLQVEDVCVVFQGILFDSDDEVCYHYLVGGVLEGAPLEPSTVEGDVMIVHGRSRDEADTIAGCALEDTIGMLRDRGVDTSANEGIITAAEVTPATRH